MQNETQALIARLEAATGPDRQLDAAIAVASGRYVYEKRGQDRQEWFYPTNGSRYERKALHFGSSGLTLERYTASIDAALALVPEGWGLVIASPGIDERFPDKWCVNMARHPDDEGNLSFAPTPALAIVIAALRAGEG